ncbi:MAG: fumarylacetoacetase [Thermoanaerobaculia bacterium]
MNSFIDSANDPTTDFPIENLPFGVFRRAGEDETPRIGVAIGDQVLDLASCGSAGLLSALDQETLAACDADNLNALMGGGDVAALRAELTSLLNEDSPARDEVSRCLVARSDAEMLLPARIGDYTDFYASVHHATNVGSMFRPDNPLLPNYKWLPVGYHGRASSIVVSGTPIRRPHGQTRDDQNAQPVFGPSRRLDYEVEVGFFIGRGNQLGERVSIDEAASRIFGFCLVNDWSARDVQTWEYQPLGPFLAKNFATSISPWVVTREALEPFRVALAPRSEGDPEPLEHLRETNALAAYDITVEVWLSTAKMRETGLQAVRLSRGNYRDMYWSAGQMVAHHASNGCNLQPGDLLASGTVSGPAKDSRGCLLELTWRGTEPLELPSGETRRFLEDGDEVVMRGFCEREGQRRIGFGECRGIVVG